MVKGDLFEISKRRIAVFADQTEVAEEKEKERPEVVEDVLVIGVAVLFMRSLRSGSEPK